MIKLRLRRMGSKRRPSYRVVVTDSRSPRDGRFIETLGYYDPLTDPATIRIDNDRARHWLGVGAQPTDTVRDILRREGLVSAKPVATVPAAAATATVTEADDEAKPKRATRGAAASEEPDGVADEPAGAPSDAATASA